MRGDWIRRDNECGMGSAECGVSMEVSSCERPSPAIPHSAFRTPHSRSEAVTASRTIRAPRGPERSCKGWVQEAALRMLMNNLDPDVAERPQDLVVYGGTGKAARDWPAFDAICRTLLTLDDDETLLVQSGKPVGVFTTHPEAPRVLRRLETRYVDRSTNSLDEALRWCEEAKRHGRALSVGLVGNCAEVLPELVRRGCAPDVVTDQTSAHDPLNGYIPAGLTLAAATALRRSAPEEYLKRSAASIALHVQAMLALKRGGAVTFDYGNNIRTEAKAAGVADAFEIPGFVPEYIRPLFCEGKGPFRWVALSGDPRDLQRTDRLVLELFPEERQLRRWIELARERVVFQGLPARICWLGQGERARFGCALNDLVKRGEIAAPVVIGRDHLDTGSVASPFRETEAMRDGSDAIADWPILNALLNTASGAGWVSFHHGGGVGIGNSLHAGQVSVADGSAAAGRRLERVLTNDPGIGVARHADSGYPEAIETARRHGIRLPMREGEAHD